jgi:hypothetical protein
MVRGGQTPAKGNARPVKSPTPLLGAVPGEVTIRVGGVDVPGVESLTWSSEEGQPPMLTLRIRDPQVGFSAPGAVVPAGTACHSPAPEGASAASRTQLSRACREWQGEGVTDRRPVNEADYLGLPAEQAASKATADGWQVRTYSRDSVITMEYRPDRLNLELDDSQVVLSARVF